ncbi:MAG: LamG domain-containing protein [Deltaproteobacteria bacterium]|nr:LamG domain-containing protein [Deltaproteobacteria bacterium]
MALWDNIQGKWKLANAVWTDDSANGYTLVAGDYEPVATAGHNGGASLGTYFANPGGLKALKITDASAPNLDITGNITFSAWIKLSTTANYMMMVSKLGASGNYSYEFGMHSNWTLRCNLSSNGTALTSAYAATVLLAGVWYHVAAVYNGTDIRLYVNGVLDSNGANNPKAYTGGIYNSTADFYAGKRTPSSYYFVGDMDDLAVWNRALSADEIRELYYLGDDYAVTPKVTGIIKDSAGTAINCSTYNVRVNAYPKNNTSSAPTKTALITATDGSWFLGNLVASTKYIVAFEYEGNYAVLNDWDIAGAEFMTAAL